ncbi:single-stranded-DNA-specific exonuclease C-terminal domain-containing protein, partial [Escherichia coli]
DVAVSEWQLFDYRNSFDMKRFFQEIFTKEMDIVTFNQQTVQKHAAILPMDQVVEISTDEQASLYNSADKQMILLDLPDSK